MLARAAGHYNLDVRGLCDKSFPRCFCSTGDAHLVAANSSSSIQEEKIKLLEAFVVVLRLRRPLLCFGAGTQKFCC
jgi:hypothetical protein